jgi:hypothetical protein
MCHEQARTKIIKLLVRFHSEQIEAAAVLESDPNLELLPIDERELVADLPKFFRKIAEATWAPLRVLREREAGH